MYFEGEGSTKFNPNRRIEDYMAQIDNIETKLEGGVKVIKEGHRVKGINPDGLQIEVPLSEATRLRLEEELMHLNFQLSGRYSAPHHNRYTKAFDRYIRATHLRHVLKSNP